MIQSKITRDVFYHLRSLSSASQFVDASRLSLGDLSPTNVSGNLAQAATVPYGLGFHGSSYQLNRVGRLVFALSFRFQRTVIIRVTPLKKIFFHFPFWVLSSCQTILASHYRTNWLSWLGLSNQVGSTTDHLNNWYLPSTPKDLRTMKLPLKRFLILCHISTGDKALTYYKKLTTRGLCLRNLIKI